MAAKTKKTAENTEFAVIKTGGKQYQVSVGDVITIEKLKGEHKKGDTVLFDKVLVVDNGSETTIGTPYITGASVEAMVEMVGKKPTVRVIKYRPKSRYIKRNGHRQPYCKVKITAIK